MAILNVKGRLEVVVFLFLMALPSTVNRELD